jgi:hypothetical protein
MVEFICFLIGIILASIFYYKTDEWRVKRLRRDGYDGAIRDIIEFGYYYDINNNKINIVVKELR